MDLGEAGGPRPAEQSSPGISVGSVVSAHVVVELYPAIEQRVRRRPYEAAVVAVADGEHAARPQHAAHLDQRSNGIGEMLEELVGVDDVK
jgi:hypothetical protein